MIGRRLVLGRTSVAGGLAAWIVCDALACVADANEATRADPRVVALAALLREHRLGGW